MIKGHTAYYFQGGVWSPTKQLGQLVRVLAQSFLGFSRLSLLEALVLALGLLGLLSRRTRSERFVLGSLVVYMLSFGLLQSEKAPRYVSQLAPFVSLIVVEGTFASLNWLHQVIYKTPRLIATTFPVVLLLGAYAGGDMTLAWRARGIVYSAYADQLAVFVPAGASVFGDGIWWFKFHQQQFTADDYLVVSHDWLASRPEEHLTALFLERHVQVILLDEQIASYWSATMPNPDPE